MSQLELKVRIVCQEENVRQVIGEQTVQTVVRGKITIPKQKPKAEQILAVRARVEEKEEKQEIEVIPDKVIVQGKIVFNVTYVADFPTQPVHHVRGQIEFAESLHIPGVRPEMDVVKQITIEKCKADVDPKDPQQIIVTVILRIFVKVTEAEPKQLLIDLPGAERKFVKDEVRLDIVKAIGRRQVVVSDQVDIQQLFQGKKPCPKEVIDTIADVTVTKKEIIQDKVIIEGILTVQIIYVADWPTQPVHHAHVEIPFTQFVEVRGARPGDMVNVQVQIEDDSARVKHECEISITAVLAVQAFVMEQIRKRVVVKIEDDLLACILDAQAIRQVTLFLDQILNEKDQVQITLREIVTIPQPKPDAQKVLEAFVTDVTVTETEVIANKVIVRGVVTVKITYVRDAPDQQVHAFQAEIPFTAFIEVPGAQPGATVNVMAEAEFVSVGLDDKRRIVVKLVLKVTARVTDIVQKKLYECLRPGVEIVCPIVAPVEPKVPEKKPVPEPKPTPPTPGRTYAIRAGDSFFRLAQRFGTTVQAIQAANPGVDPNRLQIGQVINLP